MGSRHHNRHRPTGRHVESRERTDPARPARAHEQRVRKCSLVEQTTRSRRDIAAAPGYQSWFRQRKQMLDAEFRAVVEGEMAQGNRFTVYPDGEALEDV